MSLIGFSGVAGAGDAGQPLKVGLIEYSPLVTYDAAQPEGPLFDYAQQILRAAGVTPQYMEVSINRAIEQLKNNRLDLVLTLFRSAEREAFVHYSHEPLLQVSTGFCTGFDVKKKALTSATRLAHVRGTIMPPDLQGMVLVPVNGEKAQIRMLQMMVKGRVDAIYSPKPEVILLAARSAQITAPILCYELKDSQVPIYFAFSKVLAEPIVARLDQSLQKAVRAENFDRYLQKRLKATGTLVPEVQIIDRSTLPPH